MKSKMLTSERSLTYSPCECVYYCLDYIYDFFCFPSPKRELEKQEKLEKERKRKRERGEDTIILCEEDCEKCQNFKKRRRVVTENTPLLLFSGDEREEKEEVKEEKEKEKEEKEEKENDWNIV